MKDMKSPMVIAVWICVCCLAFASGSEVQFGEKYIFLHNTDTPVEKDGLSLLVLSWPENQARGDIEECITISDQELVRDIYRTTNNPRVHELNSNELESIRKDCHELSHSRRKRSLGNEPINRVEDNKVDGDESYMIWPGTKWCGAGDNAANDDDLGEYVDEDKCCRAHDKCDDLLLAGESKGNITNESSYTQLSCPCDKAFYECLESVDSFTSNSIGNVYFNALPRKCYELDYPDTETCKEYIFLNIGCKEYEKDTSAPKSYQWKPLEHYSNFPFPKF